MLLNLVVYVLPLKPGGASYYRALPKLNDSVIDFNDEFQRNRLRALQSVDEMIKAIINKLDERGALENTYVVFTTDNGFHLSQHRLFGGKRCGLETDIRIPFAVRGPGIPAGTVNEAVTNHVDMSTTLLALVGAPERPHLDGAIMPWTQELQSLRNDTCREHTQVEHWGPALSEGYAPYMGIAQTEFTPNNTFYSARIISEADGYSFYYSVWCTNEHELYDMKVSRGPERNLTWLIVVV